MDTMDIRTYLQDHIMLFDGAMGTYFSSIYEDPLYPCEWANITSPNTIRRIHKEYLQAGAKAIKTNTFCVWELMEQREPFTMEMCIDAAYKIASEEAAAYDAFVFCDIGPIPNISEQDVWEVYKRILDTFLSLGGKYYLFETFLDDVEMEKIASYIKERVEDAYIIASFAVQPDGYTSKGHYGRNLASKETNIIDAVGFNCVCGPHHMKENLKKFGPFQKPLLVMPNASYPTVLGNRVRYENNPAYFAKQMMDIVEQGGTIIGGCCGTTPLFVEEMGKSLEKRAGKAVLKASDHTVCKKSVTRTSKFYEQLTTGKYPIAVELDSPPSGNAKEFMQGAQMLKDAGVDLLTIADCPVARARMDSCLLACKVKRELELDTLPHMTCRDRNMNASKALLYGLAMEEINNVLVVTGDPIPSAQRGEVKSVYEFNSRMMIHHIKELNESQFESPFYLYAALNINAINFSVQLSIAKDKIKNGAVGFFTQPVLSKQGLENLKLAKETLSVPIIGGIMPVVSYRNACFMNSEIPGITVCDEIVSLYEDKNRDECTQLAIKISTEVAREIKPYIDGYYIITPFKRVDLVAAIINNIYQNIK